MSNKKIFQIQKSYMNFEVRIHSNFFGKQLSAEQFKWYKKHIRCHGLLAACNLLI